ncbi:hypothetical protein DFH09DRAFT_1370552 [Mycena vulgaris]|nr:hypothetical protein DFH09DRAFT_1370552 [Mycena vulgaris]
MNVLGHLTSCHECLLSLELFEEILRHIEQPVGSGNVQLKRGARHLLLSIALTCKAFAEPALHLLWRRLDSPFRLLELLPRFRLMPGLDYYSSGPLEPKDWIRFDRYADSVREIMHGSEVLLNDDMITHLAEHRQPLLPKLTAFRAPARLSEVWQTLLLGKVLIENAGTPGNFTLAPSGSPRLTHLVLDPSLSVALPEEFHGLQFLKYNHRGNNSPIMGPTASLLPRLRSLVIHLFAWGDRGPPPPVLALPSLRDLNIRATHALVLWFLTALQSEGLESICLQGDWKQTPQDLCQLTAWKWAGTLRDFELNAWEFEDLAPLYPCTCLERVTVKTALPFRLDVLLGMTRTWANLTALSVPVGANGIDVAALAHIAQCFPRLLDLEFYRLTSSLATTALLSHGLKRLVLHSPPPRDARGLAFHLHRLFPRLDSIRHAGQRHDAQGRWAEVLAEVFRFQDSRQLEGP